MTKAEDLRTFLEPKAQQGNWIAEAMLDRLDAAEDPDAEAEQIIRDIQVFVRRIVAAFHPIVVALEAAGTAFAQTLAAEQRKNVAHQAGAWLLDGTS